MVKCDKCGKNITKANPGLECNRCEKIVHLNGSCSGLTNKQRTSLKGAENLEWTCPECLEHSPKRSSILIPGEYDKDDEDSDGKDNTGGIDVKKLLKDISKEVEKTIQRELREITKALDYQSEKMDEFNEALEAIKGTIKELKKNNTELRNKSNHLETRVGALDQRLRDIEQSQLNKNVEIANVPYVKSEILSNIITKAAEKLQVPTHDIVYSKRAQGRNDKPGTIELKFNNDNSPKVWVKAAKETPLVAEDLIEDLELAVKKNKIHIREALSHFNKKLLWDAKMQLKNGYKFIWYKGGVIRARKDEKDEAIIIRSEDDILKLLSRVGGSLNY